MDFLLIGSLAFLLALLFGFAVTPIIIQYFIKKQVWCDEVKKTMYGVEASEFNAIQKRYKDVCTIKMPTPRLGGVTFFPIIILLLLASIFFNFSTPFFVILMLLAAASLFALYDDLLDIDKLKTVRHLSVKQRLSALFLIAFVGGIALQQVVPNTITFLPFETLSIETGILFALIFAIWITFWQLSSVIDGIDGLAGSIFLTLFIGTGILSLLQTNGEAYVLSAMGMGMIIPFLFFNYEPAKLNLTEVGITILVFLYGSITFLLALGTNTGPVGGVGIWAGLVFGLILIVTWVSNIIQLSYRRKTGKKLLRIAPIHHHFEAVGFSRRQIVRGYTGITALAVALPIIFVFIL